HEVTGMQVRSGFMEENLEHLLPDGKSAAVPRQPPEPWCAGGAPPSPLSVMALGHGQTHPDASRPPAHWLSPSWPGASRPPTPSRWDRRGGRTTASAWVAGTHKAMTERADSAQPGAGGRSGRAAIALMSSALMHTQHLAKR